MVIVKFSNINIIMIIFSLSQFFLNVKISMHLVLWADINKLRKFWRWDMFGHVVGAPIRAKMKRGFVSCVMLCCISVHITSLLGKSNSWTLLKFLHFLRSFDCQSKLIWRNVYWVFIGTDVCLGFGKFFWRGESNF